MTHFIIDENLSFDLIPFLQKKGYTVSHIKKMGLAGTKNGEIYKLVEKKKSWLITKDKDFSVKEKFDDYEVGGIIVLNISDESTRNIKNYIDLAFRKLNNNFSLKKLVLVRDKELLIL